MTTDAAEAVAYTAEVDREEGWWTIHIVDLDVITQAAHWSEVENMARGVVIAMLDLEEDAPVEVELVPVFDDEAGRLLQTAEEWEARARELIASASDAKRAAVQTLKQAGWTLQSIAAGIGLSYQRVEQLLKEVSAAGTQSSPPREPGRNARSASAKPKKAPVAGRSATPSRYVTTATAKHPRTSVASRSAVTGRYVTKSTAKRNESSTDTGRR